MYNTPKVTIDLKEYNDLIAARDGLSADEYVVAAKKIVAAMLNRKGDAATVLSDLKKDGILFTVSTPPSATSVRPDDIHISKIKANQQ